MEVVTDVTRGSRVEAVGLAAGGVGLAQLDVRDCDLLRTLTMLDKVLLQLGAHGEGRWV